MSSAGGGVAPGDSGSRGLISRGSSQGVVDAERRRGELHLTPTFEHLGCLWMFVSVSRSNGLEAIDGNGLGVVDGS